MRELPSCKLRNGTFLYTQVVLQSFIQDTILQFLQNCSQSFKTQRNGRERVRAWEWREREERKYFVFPFCLKWIEKLSLTNIIGQKTKMPLHA